MKSLLDGLPPEVAQRIHPDWQRNETAYWAVRDTLLPQYRDQWIAFANGRVLVSGASAVEVLHAAQASGLHPFVTCVGREHEPSRMRRVVFAYDTTYPHEALPVIPVEFRAQETAPGLVYEQMIPDTGADASALPWADCAQLALDPRHGVPGLIGGVGTTAAPTVVFAVWAHLDGQTYPCRLQADFTGHERILGRDVLNRLDILFRGPQQEVISPVLCTMVLDGLEQALHEAFSPTRSGGRRNQVHLVRYADDFIITGRTQELLVHAVQPVVERCLTQRGLALSPTKTHITHIAAGFDILGTPMRKYDGKFLMKPSKKSVQAVLGKSGTTIKQHLHAGAGHLLVQLNPIIRGWANSHRHTSRKETCANVAHEVYQKLWGWAKRRHPTKRRGWIKKKYFGASATRSWAYGGTRTRPNGDQQKLRLTRTRETPITRHTKIQNHANPYDPEWGPYFEDRLRLQMQDDLKGRRKLLDLWRDQGEAARCAVSTSPQRADGISTICNGESQAARRREPT